jgi:hypothetical protein
LFEIATRRQTPRWGVNGAGQGGPEPERTLALPVSLSVTGTKGAPHTTAVAPLTQWQQALKGLRRTKAIRIMLDPGDANEP